MNLNDTKSSKDLRKEITQDLDRLDSNIDALKDRMSPGQMIDDAIFRNYRGDPKRSFNYLKSNPVGSSFLALGTLLLMDNEGESYEQYLKKQSKIAYEEYRIKASDLKLKATHTRERIGNQVEEMSRDVKNRTRELMQQGEEKLQGIKQKVSRKGQEIESNVTQAVTEASEGIRDNVIDATESFKERAQQARGELQLESTGKLQDMRKKAGEYGRNVSEKFKENGYDSLAYLSIGLGTGFATGSLIPLGDETEGDLGLDFDFSQLRHDLEQAVNESVNLFKNEIIDGLKNRNVDIF